MLARPLVFLLILGSCRIGYDHGGEGPALGEHNVVFVTSTLHVPGELGGLEAADAICNELAAGAGLSGTYVAWLSASEVDAIDRIAGARGWVRPDGRPFIDRPSDLVAGAIYYPPRLDERGQDVGTTYARVATGTTPSGRRTGETCSDYTSSEGALRAGRAHATAHDFTEEGGLTSCSAPLALYCFGIDKREPLAPPVPGEGRLAFLSSSTFTLGGLEAADAQCAEEAALANLPGSYLALLGVSGVPAADRFDLEGPPWVRLDGVALAPSAFEFMAGALETSLHQTAVGAYAALSVWTGGAPLSPPAANCSSWTDPTASGRAGRSSFAGSGLFGSSNTGCGNAARIYCLEE